VPKIGESLATGRQALVAAPSLLPQGGIYRWQRSQVTRAATFPQRLRQWTYGKRLIDGMDCLDGFGFLFHCTTDLVFISRILVTISMYLFGFGKLA